MNSLDIISDVVQMFNNVYMDFNQSFYIQNDISMLKNLKHLKVDDAYKDNYFKRKLVPNYLSSLDKNLGAGNRILTELADDYNFRFRIKLIATIYAKLRHNCDKDRYIAKILNDCLGGRIILADVQSQEHDISVLLQKFQKDDVISRFYTRDEGHYHAIHCYFQHTNRWFPWELQIWDQKDSSDNYAAHLQHEKDRES